MAGSGWRTFVAGQVLTAAQVQGYLQDQAVQVYASSTARSSALGTSVSAGMMSFLTATESLDLYTHGIWTGINYSSITNATATTYTIASTDGNSTINFSNAAAQTVTVPDILDIGERVDLVRDGAGTVIIAAGTGVTTWAGAGTAGTATTFKINTQYGGASVMKVAANSYRVIGNVIP
jgi:hypothetical protein